ncbi:479_t:CDS:1, partial [Acaulospora colombiana]
MSQDSTAYATTFKLYPETNQSTNWSEEVENNIMATKNPIVNHLDS